MDNLNSERSNIIDQMQLSLFAHPDLKKSFVSAKLFDKFQRHGGSCLKLADILNERRWPKILPEHRQYLQEFSHFNIIFPIHWYNIPHTLQKWFEDVFVSGFGFGDSFPFEGKTARLVVSAGGKEEDYTSDGKYGKSLKALLSPIRLTLKHLKFNQVDPLYIYSAYKHNDVSIEKLFQNSILRYKSSES